MPITFRVDYDAFEYFTIPSNVDLKKIEKKWIKWGILYYVIDGVCYSISGSGTETDEKFPIDQWDENDKTDQFFERVDYDQSDTDEDTDEINITIEGKYDNKEDCIK